MANLTPADFLGLMTRNFIVSDTSVTEQTSFIEDQIADPFNAGNSNYLKRLADIISGDNEMDDQCQRFMVQIQDVYPHLRIEIGDYDQHLLPLFTVIYNVFVRKVKKITYNFIREYIFNNKNRKTLTDMFSNTKTPTYPKEQYGKKEYYILVTKLPQIIDEIFEDGVKLKRFIDIADKSEHSPACLSKLKDYLDEDLIVDNGVVGDIYEKFKECDDYRSMLNDLEIDITNSFILPYIKENNLGDLYLPPVNELEDDDDDEDDD